MSEIRKIQVTTGVHWIEIPEANIRMLCGCPADTVKHLRKKGLITTIEKNGVRFETGPNVILLSDVLIQNGHFSNVTEFPVLQMMYLQGMLIPHHPNNDGTKPLLIGTEEQVRSQINYIFRGNYGLISKEELLEAGISEPQAEEMMQIKLKFAFGNIVNPENLIETRILRNETTPIRNGVTIKRIKRNIFLIEYQNRSVEVDLNLSPEEKYEPPYLLDHHFIKREYFAVIHSGEGDGWDVHRPCMASILMYQGKIYLIDAGPNIMATLNYLGISVNEIEGIFQTHVHDDHFAGLATLVRSDRRLKLFSSKMVIHSVAKKLCALMSIREEIFPKLFDLQELTLGEWTNIEGLYVLPAYSPHPVDTNVFFFRVSWQGGYKTYAHLADTSSFAACERILRQHENDIGMSVRTYEETRKTYLTPVNLKKIDIGGGLIHGVAEDYREDTSEKIVLAHISRPLTLAEREIGSTATFGMTDVLIPSQRDYLIEFAWRHLRFYFPTVPDYEINFLLNHPIVNFNSGSILLKKGILNEYVYLLLTGSVESADAKVGKPSVFSAGSLVGFYADFLKTTSQATYWASSNIYALQIPICDYQSFVERNHLYSELKRLEDNLLFLSETWIFGKVVSFPILSKVALESQTILVEQTTVYQQHQIEDLFLIKQGEALLQVGDFYEEKLLPTDFFCTESIMPKTHTNYKVTLYEGVELFQVPIHLITEIPIVYWKALEIHNKRVNSL
ncbi:MAG: MBL fold metallo-hydrolase [Cytophagales bacterium]|nr:MBL fold metallo-hydrolase [Cytophagales bacterium]MDW8384085.1 MBL fold metallo-hydrolase [Flammeovirgaceae bacterium]